MEVLNIKKINAENLKTLVRKFLLMDTSIFLNITKDSVFSNSYLPTKDVVKVAKYKLEDIFEIDDDISNIIKISIHTGSVLIDDLKFFDLNKLTGKIEYYQDGNDCIAEKIIMEDGKQKIIIHCADPEEIGFISMTDDQVKKAFDTSSLVYKFDLSIDELSTIIALNARKKSQELFEIYSDSNGVHACDNDYDRIIDAGYTTDTDKIMMFKHFLNRVDKENYICMICKNKVILKSKDTNTIIGLNLAIKG